MADLHVSSNLFGKYNSCEARDAAEERETEKKNLSNWKTAQNQTDGEEDEINTGQQIGQEIYWEM